MKSSFLVALSVILLMLSFTSCVESVEDSAEFINNEGDKVITDKIFTVPSPFQVAALLSVLDLKYDETLISINNNSKEYNTNDAKALNLGMKIIDFGYYSLFSKHLESHKIALQLDWLSKDLGLKESNSDDLYKRYKVNCENKDSLAVYLKSFQKEFENSINLAREKNLELLVFSGLIVEGMYLGIKVYNTQISKQKVSKFIKKPMKNMLLEQKVFLENILELYEIKSYEPRRQTILDGLNAVKTGVDNLNIKYSIDDEDNSINNIRFDRNNLLKLQEVVSQVRTGFINYSN